MTQNGLKEMTLERDTVIVPKKNTKKCHRSLTQSDLSYRPGIVGTPSSNRFEDWAEEGLAEAQETPNLGINAKHFFRRHGKKIDNFVS